jgi:DNA-directed RNA polymerase subunit M/transcription elongation factor TFIIS
MQTVGNFPDLASAQMAAAALRSDGIESLIPDEHLAGVDWQMGTALHGIRLQVAPDDVEAAEALLAELQTEVATDDAPADEVCPKCGSEQIGPAKWKQRIKAYGLFFPPALLAWPLYALLGPLNTCRKCGHEWR